jgi:hypothetical protein
MSEAHVCNAFVPFEGGGIRLLREEETAAMCCVWRTFYGGDCCVYLQNRQQHFNACTLQVVFNIIAV